jgi:hypothetical protein
MGHWTLRLLNLQSSGFVLYGKIGRILKKHETVAGVISSTVCGYDLAGRLESITEDGTESRDTNTTAM